MPKTEVAYLGPEGTFAHLVALQRYRNASLVPLRTIADIFDYVSKGPKRQGVVPIENSSGGTIHDTVDCLIAPSCPLSVQEEMSIRVNLALIGRKGERIRTVYSHFAPLHHCEEWLRRHFPGVEHRIVSSTGEAARLVSTSKEAGAAAISARGSAKIYKLDVLEFPIVQSIENITQFFAVGHKNGRATNNAKSSLVVSLHNTPGSLCLFLEPFKNAGVNLSRIVSRPVMGRPNEYIFFVDIAGTEKDEAVRKALATVRKTSISVRIAGTYPVRRPFDS